MVAVEGDMVTLHWICTNEDGEVRGARCWLPGDYHSCLPTGVFFSPLKYSSWGAPTLRVPRRAAPWKQVLESSRMSEEPTTFEVGAGDIVGNKVFEVRRRRRGSRCWWTPDSRIPPAAAALEAAPASPTVACAGV